MHRRRFTVLLLLAVSVFASGRWSRATPPQGQGRTPAAVHVEMRNVMYHCTDQIAVHLLQLQGLVLPTPRTRLPVVDDVQSFTLALHFAERVAKIFARAEQHALNQARHG